MKAITSSRLQTLFASTRLRRAQPLLLEKKESLSPCPHQTRLTSSQFFSWRRPFPNTDFYRRSISFPRPGLPATLSVYRRFASSMSEKRKAEEGSFAKKESASELPPQVEKNKRKKTAAFTNWFDKNKSTNPFQKDSDSIHNGSYAFEGMRKQFGVDLPQVDEASTVDAEGETNKRTKRRVAFLLGYLGTEFAGFQINNEQKTLQAEFELALFRANLLDTRNFGNPNKYGWSTSGRTDKGVHACAQVCSCKIEMLPDMTVDDVREQINAHLPADFRVLDVVRVTRAFCARTQRDRVRYKYLIPSYCFFERNALRGLFEKTDCTKNEDQQEADALTPDQVKEMRSHLVSYRATPEQLKTLKSALASYEGTHSFHNFTKRVSKEEARATRFILSFQVSDPVISDDGTEWIPTHVLGQSFLLNQIRKMICMAIDVTRGVAPVGTISAALAKDSDIRVAVAPAQGLYMDMAYYAGYNRRKMQNKELEELDWAKEGTPVHKRWKDFSAVITKHVVQEEGEEGNFIKHLFSQEYSFDCQKGYALDTPKEEEKG